MDLSTKKCLPCEGGAPAFDPKQIAEYRENIEDGWNVIAYKKITKDFHFGKYDQTISFVNKVAALAEEENHHPVLHVYYGHVVVELWTHSVNGLSENDFILAAKIDKL
ncbi:MAG TPA: 4a-hydroxytetrahydrobiopterin dehydratase [Prolixibacteraceae bacterium]|nr:4a-hydroxytetrahydrobiopterin dehydratase [Prolixibacteraceae bacterium]